MKVLLTKDVYKLGRAGDVKRVADGYGRNYLLPQGLAVLATPGALKRVEHIRVQADAQRTVLNKEMGGIAERIEGLVVTFPARASETGKLYGSITTQMIADAISKKIGSEVSRRQVDSQPLRMLGEYPVHVRLTVDLVPTVTVIVHREGEAVSLPGKEEPVEAAPETAPEPEPLASIEAEEPVPAEAPAPEAEEEVE